MKKLVNKPLTYAIKEPDPSFMKMIDKEKKSSYFEIILEMCERPANLQTGFSYSEIKTIDRIRTALHGKDEAEIEESDFEYLKPRIENWGWSTPNIQFVQLTDYIKSL